MYEKLESCPSCKHTSFSNHMICEDHLVSGESFALVKCAKCQLVFTNPRPDEPSITDYYQSEAYISHQNKANSPINILYKVVRRYTTYQKLQLLKSYKSSGRLLDYGCGTGYFLHQANRYDRTGYDSIVTNQADQQIKFLTDFSQLKKQDKFDLITAWHVIEHVHNLTQTLKALRKSLKVNGVMFIALPNLSSYDAMTYGSNWAGYDVPRHLYHFNKLSFGALLKKLKLQLIDVAPMYFDSYYVSMLSEKNKPESGGLISALKTGYASNKAAQKDMNYSSLIYIISR